MTTEQPKTQWQPLQRQDNDPAYVRNPNLEEATVQAGMRPADEIWTNDRYQVTVRFLQPEHAGLQAGRTGMISLSIHRHDRRRLRDWRHLQQIKNEVAGANRTAVEIFPSEARLVDTSNEYHLWVLPEGVELPFGFDEGLVSSNEQVDQFNDARERGHHKGRQHPWEGGLTTGRNDQTKYLSDDDGAAAIFERLTREKGG